MSDNSAIEFKEILILIMVGVLLWLLGKGYFQAAVEWIMNNPLFSLLLIGGLILVYEYITGKT